ncbi:MAG: tyrosine-type recombinase/integrase [Terriglobia bacterium]
MNYATHLAWWQAHLGPVSLADLTPAHLAACRDQLAQARHPATVNRYLATLSHVLTVTVQEWGWLAESPMRRVRRLREPPGRVRCLDDAERARLLRACQASSNRWLYPVVVLALSTGARKMELLGLTWKDVDLRQARVVVQHTKNRQRRA